MVAVVHDFQFYSVPGESAVTESVKALLQPADDNAVESFGAYSPAGEAGDGKKRKRPGLDSVAKKMAGARTVLGWGGIENYFRGCAQKFTVLYADFGQPLQVPGQDQTRAQGEARRAPKHPSRDRGDGKGGIGFGRRGRPGWRRASGRDRRVSENEKNSRRSARNGRGGRRCTAWS